MLKMIGVEIDNAVAFQMSGKITESDMTLVLNNAKEKIESNDSIVILEKIDSFKGVETAAIVEEFKYLYEVGMSNIRKVALVTDEKWIEHILRIEDKVFSNIEMKCFTIQKQAEAIEFLKRM